MKSQSDICAVIIRAVSIRAVSRPRLTEEH